MEKTTRFFRNLLILLVAAGLFLAPAPALAVDDAQLDQSLREGENRPTLDPAQFGHPLVRQAYQAAKEIPWVLDSIYCYCRCKENPNFRHKSLLSCYVDLHASA
jgi:hypothetical protein